MLWDNEHGEMKWTDLSRISLFSYKKYMHTILGHSVAQFSVKEVEYLREELMQRRM